MLSGPTPDRASRPRARPQGVRTALALLLAAVLPAREVTFVSTSDCHYRQADHPLGHHNDLNRATLEAINAIEKLRWPEKLGERPIARPPRNKSLHRPSPSRTRRELFPAEVRASISFAHSCTYASLSLSFATPAAAF